MRQWFDIYKEFAANPFFIAGESYAGIYVPTLASEVAKGNPLLYVRTINRSMLDFD